MRNAAGDSQCVNVATLAPLCLAKHSEHSEYSHTHSLRDSPIGVSISRDLCAQQKGYKIFIVSCCMANDKQTIRPKKKPPMKPRKKEAEGVGKLKVEVEATAECVCKL